ncbi:MAG: BT_3987 domain-containing protein [Alistipes onderdonkii]
MKLNKLNIAVAALAAVALAGCKNEDLSRQHYDNKLFISATNFTDEMLIKAANSSYEREITAGIAKPVGQDISIEFAAAPELFDHYRQAFYDEDVKLLSEEFYQFDETKTRIQAGSVASVPVTIRFVDVNLLDKNERYVLPVTIRSVSGIDVLPSARSVYYIFKGAALINVVAGITENRAWPDWKDASPVTNMRTFTLEALINGNAFKNQISTIMGIEGKFLVRIGDSGVDPNQIQIASSRNLTNSDLKLDAGRWYHVAVTFESGSVKVYLDGVEKCSGNVGTSSVNFGVKHSDESDGKPVASGSAIRMPATVISTARSRKCVSGTRPLTPEEINAPDHFYQVAAASDGLVAYWKFDEGAGKTIKDQTSYGNDLTVEEGVEVGECIASRAG